MLQRPQGGTPHGSQVLGDRAGGVHRAAHDHRVHEVPHGTLLVREVLAQGHRAAEGNVPPGAVQPPRECHGVAQQHEGRDAVLAAHAVHAFAQLCGDLQHVRVALVPRSLRAGTVQGQVELRGQAAQLLGPEALVRRRLLGVLGGGLVVRGLGPLRCAPGGPRPVGVGEVREQGLDGLRVDRHVVHHDQQQRRVPAGPQIRAGRGLTGDVDGLGRVSQVLGDDALQRLAARSGLRQGTGEVVHAQRGQLLSLQHAHARGAVTLGGEHGAQGAVAQHDVVPGRPQCLRVHGAAQFEGHRHVVDRGRALQLLHKPQPLLRGSQDRSGAGRALRATPCAVLDPGRVLRVCTVLCNRMVLRHRAVLRHGRVAGHLVVTGHGVVRRRPVRRRHRPALREPRNGGRGAGVEHLHEGDGDAASPQPAEQAHGGQGVPAERKEVLVDVHSGAAQQLGHLRGHDGGDAVRRGRRRPGRPGGG